jgi:hypothetical protein
LGRPAIAYSAACCTAGLILCTASLIWGIGLFTASSALLGVLQVGLYLAVFVAVVAILPTLIAVALLYETRLRRGFTEVVVGGLLGFFITTPFLLGIGDNGPLDRVFWIVTMVFALAGSAAGLTYWLVLGCPKNPNRRQ